MKTKSYKKPKNVLFSTIIVLAAMATFSLDIVNAEDDMMGAMPSTQQPSNSKPMQSDSSNTPDSTDNDHDHDMMKADHEQMKKDHKKMKKDAKSSMTNKHQHMKKTGKKKDKSMQMNNPDPSMMDDDSMPPADKPKDPAGGMGHM